MAKVKAIFISLLALIFSACSNGVDGPVSATDPEESSTFDISVTDVTATSARVSVTSTDKAAHYYLEVLRAEYFEVYNTQYGFQRLVDSAINALMTNNELTFNQALDLLLCKGSATKDFSALEPNSSYYAVVIPLALNGHIHSDIVATSFTTDTE